jgi:hypothetical protein
MGHSVPVFTNFQFCRPGRSRRNVQSLFVAEIYWTSHKEQPVGLEDTVTLLVSLVTTLGVMLILLGVCLVVVRRRRRHRGAPPSAPRAPAPPLIYDPDRVALIANGAQLGEVRF